MNHNDATSAIELFESAVRAHENMGSQRPTEWLEIEQNLEGARINVGELLKTSSILLHVKSHCESGYKDAQSKIRTDGYSSEQGFRTDTYQEILNLIGKLEA